MKARNIALRVGAAADSLAEPAGWLGAAVAFVDLVYLLTAPPIILAHVRQTGSCSFRGVTAAINARSRRLMERLGFTRNESEDFLHPLLEENSPFRLHVLYRKPNKRL